MKRYVSLLIVLIAAALFAHSAQGAITLSPEKAVSSAFPVLSYSESAPVRVASNGSDFLVVWQSRGAARVTAEGHVLDAPSIVLPQPDLTREFDVVWNGSEYVIAWSTETALSFVTVSSTTGETRQLSINVPFRPGGTGLRLARSGSVLAAAYWDPKEMRPLVTLFTMSGSVIKSLELDGSPREIVVTDAGEFVLLLGPALVVVSRDGNLVREISLPTNTSGQDLATSGDEFAVLADQFDQLLLIRLSGDGKELSTTPLLGSGEKRFGTGTLARVGGGFAVSWESHGTEPIFVGQARGVDLWSARVSGTGNVLERNNLVSSIGFIDRLARPPAAPDLASNGDTALVAWAKAAEPTLKGDAIMAMPLPSNGESQPIGVATIERRQRVAAVASNGPNALLLWYETPFIFRASRITSQGDYLDPDGILIAPNGYGRAAFDGEATVIAWSDGTGVYGTRVATDGKLMGAPFRISTRRDAGAPSIACSRSTCVVAWTGITEEQKAGIYVARTRHDAVLDVNGIFVAEGTQAAIASNGDTFLLTVVRPATPDGSILSAGLIAGADQSLQVTPTDFAASTARLGTALVIWDGERYVAAWSESGVGLRASRFDDAGNSIDGEATSWHGQHIMSGVVPSALAIIGGAITVASDGELIMLSRETLQVEQRIQLDLQAKGVEIAATSDGGGIVAYSRSAVDQRNISSTRVFYRVIAPPARHRAVQRAN